MSTRKQFKVYKEDCDNFGLIRYTKYIDWMETAKADFFKEAGVGLDYFKNKEINFVTVNMNLRCMEECHENDQVEIETLSDRVMTNSIFLTFIGKNIVSSETIFKIDVELYSLDSNGQVIPIPEVDKEKLQKVVEVQFKSDSC